LALPITWIPSYPRKNINPSPTAAELVVTCGKGEEGVIDQCRHGSPLAILKKARCPLKVASYIPYDLVHNDAFLDLSMKKVLAKPV